MSTENQKSTARPLRITVRIRDELVDKTLSAAMR